MNRLLYVCLLLAFSPFFTLQQVKAQDSSSTTNKIINFPGKLFTKVNAKVEAFDARLTTQSQKYLQRMAGIERRMYKKLSRKDSASAQKVFGEAAMQYALLQQNIEKGNGKIAHTGSIYLPHLDSLQAAFNFLDKTGGLFNIDPKTDRALKEAVNSLQHLQNKFSEAAYIKQFMKQRQHSLQEQVGAFGYGKELKKLKQEVYYYQAQVNEYKRAFENPSLLEARALAIIKKTHLFKDFFRKRSQLAGLFMLPEPAPGNPMAGFAGLQTRQNTQQQLMQRFGSLPDIQQLALQQGAGASSPISVLKSKMENLRLENNDDDMPDFKPNHLKTKSFKSRLELGTNLQTVRGNNFFPSTSDIALSVGYKLNEKSIVGIGGSYKMGWGKDIRHITISHQGIGFRSFVDYRIRGGFWLTGGAEMNYRSQFSNYEILNDYAPWQKSALIGLSKKYQATKKFRGNVQLLYDCLYKQQVPRTPPLLFRVGYTL